MEKYEIQLSQEAAQNIEETLQTLIEAQEDIQNSAEADFEKLKNKKWYNRLWELVTFSKDNQKIQARGVTNLARLNEIIMKSLLLISKQNKDIAEKVLKSFEKINDLSGEIQNLQKDSERFISELLTIIRGFNEELVLSELDADKQIIIRNLFVKFACDCGLGKNEESQYIVSNVKKGDVNLEGVSYGLIDKLSSSDIKLLIKLVELYHFSIKDDYFDNCAPFEISGRFSKCQIDQAVEALKQDLKIMDIGHVLDNLLSDKIEEIDTSVDEENIDFVAELYEEEIIDDNDYTELTNLIMSYAKDEGIEKCYLGTDADKTNLSNLLAKMKLFDVSPEAVIVAFETDCPVLFTTKAFYYNKKDNCLPYVNITKDIFTKTIVRESDQKLIIKSVNGTFVIDDSKVNENKLEDLFFKIIDTKPNISNVDRNLPLKDMPDTIKLNFVLALMHLLKYSDLHFGEIYKLCFENDYLNIWEDALECYQNNSIDDETVYNLIDEAISAIPYPSKNSIANEMLITAYNVLYHTKCKNELSYVEETLLTRFNINHFSDEDKNILISSILTLDEFIAGKISVEEYKKIENKAKMLLKQGGLILLTNGISGIAPALIVPFGMLLVPILTTAKTISKYKKINKMILEGNNERNVLIEMHFESYLKTCRSLLNRPDDYEIVYDFLRKKLFGYVCLKFSQKVEINQKFVDALVTESPEILLNYQCKQNKSLTENDDIKEAENLILQYKIAEALRLLKKCAEENGIGRINYHLGEIYAWGYGGEDINEDLAKVKRFKGSEQGDILSTLNANYMLPDSDRKNQIIALIEYLLDSKEKDAFEDYELAMIKKNSSPKEAIDLLISSSNKGFFRAINYLGNLYYTGNLVNKDKNKAFELWEQSAKLGYEPAVYNIFKYFNKNHTDFEKIANDGFPPALNYRAFCKIQGFNGYQKDLPSAYADLEKAANKGYSYAIKNHEIYKKKGKVGFFTFEYEFDPIK